MKYIVTDSETNNAIFGEFGTREEAEYFIEELEEDDMKAVNYTEGYYEIVEEE